MLTTRCISTSRLRKTAFLIVASLLLCPLPGGTAEQDTPLASHDSANPVVDKVFVTVDDMVITWTAYQEVFRGAVRQKYYHGKVPTDELALFQRKVTHDIIDQLLLLREAKRMGLAPNLEAVRDKLEQFEVKLARDQKWPEQRAVVMPMLGQRFSNEDQLMQLETKIRNTPYPTLDEAKAYYENHPDKFTEPQRTHVSVIHIGVSPSSPSSQWDATRDQVKTLFGRIQSGDNFGDLARQFSTDPSAERAGDLGYLHQGRLADEAQVIVDKLDIGAVSEPITLLDGVALFLVQDRIAPDHKRFSEVQERASKLLHKTRQDQAWQDFVEQTRKAAHIVIDETYFMPMGEQVEPNAIGGHSPASG